jgi:hypothetical protein
MKHKQTDTTLRDTIMKAASRWLAEKQSPFAVVEEFASFVGKPPVSVPLTHSLLAEIFACGFPCVRGDKGERVLWLRPTRSGSSSCLSFAPSETVRQFTAALPKAEAEAA